MGRRGQILIPVAVQVKVISERSGCSHLVGSKAVLVCSHEQLQGKLGIYVFLTEEEIFLKPFLCVWRQIGVVIGEEDLWKRVQAYNLVFCSYCPFLQIPISYSAALLPVYDILIHFFVCKTVCYSAKMMPRNEAMHFF